MNKTTEKNDLLLVFLLHRCTQGENSSKHDNRADSCSPTVNYNRVISGYHWGFTVFCLDQNSSVPQAKRANLIRSLERGSDTCDSRVRRTESQLAASRPGVQLQQTLPSRTTRQGEAKPPGITPTFPNTGNKLTTRGKSRNQRQENVCEGACCVLAAV